VRKKKKKKRLVLEKGYSFAASKNSGTLQWLIYTMI